MFVLLEMTDDQITARLLAYMTGIDMGRLERDELSLEDRARIEEAFKEISEWKLMIYCDPSMNVADIRAIQMRERFDLIVVDYLQRMDFKDFSEVPRIAKQLKNIALTTKCSIDLFSQLTPKGLDSRSQNPFSKPDNNSLYGGKATAFEADNVIFLWAHRQMDEDGGWNNRTGYGTLIFAKVRQGRPGLEVNMKFDHTRIQWEEA
jgi:replicative DNA helicase